MALQLWSPMRGFDALRQEFDQLFEQMLGRRGGWPQLVTPSSGVPLIESFVEGDKLIVRADLPGVDAKNVDITIANDMLTVSGSRHDEREEHKRNYSLREVSYGSFERSISVPRGLKAEDVKAKYSNGVLELTMPLPKEAAPRKVPIEVAATKSSSAENASVKKEEKPKAKK